MRRSVSITLICVPLFLCSCQQLENDWSCGYKDGSYTCTVFYHNPKTGYKNEYELDVDVSDCEVYRINFSNGGSIDEGDFNPQPIKDGWASLKDVNGAVYDVQLPEFDAPDGE